MGMRRSDFVLMYNRIPLVSGAQHVLVLLWNLGMSRDELCGIFYELALATRDVRQNLETINLLTTSVSAQWKAGYRGYSLVKYVKYQAMRFSAYLRLVESPCTFLTPNGTVSYQHQVRILVNLLPHMLTMRLSILLQLARNLHSLYLTHSLITLTESTATLLPWAMPH